MSTTMLTEAERQLAALVSMPTITDDIPANMIALDYIEAYLTKRGMHAKRFVFDGHGALVASTRPDNAKKPTVLLAAHVDVMTGSEQLFTLREVDGKLLGRGVYDMKHAIATYMQAIDDLHKRDTLKEYDLAIMITSDEERGGRDNINGTDKLVAAGYLPTICVLPDSTAPGWEVEKLAKGHWRFELIAKGRTAHGSRPWEGESASFKLIQALHELKTVFQNHGPATDTLNIGFIHGGEAYNQIPSLMSAAVEIRVVSEESYQKYVALMQNICERHDVQYIDRAFFPPVQTNLELSFIQAYVDCVQQVTGRRPKGYTSFAASDTPYFDAAGVPCILSCPEGGKHHSEDEWIDKASFLQGAPILHAFLDRVARKPSKPAKQVDKKRVLSVK